jgi:hypothetical protein
MEENIKETSYKVMKTGQYNQAVFYQVSCDCGSKDHQMGLEMDVDDGIFTLHFYGDFETTAYWGRPNWFTRQWKKIKLTLRLWFIGYIEMEQEFLLIDDKHINSFIGALEEGKQLLKEERGKENGKLETQSKDKTSSN